MLPTLVVMALPVSFSAPADAASRLLPRLGAAMGQRLTADSRVGAQVLLVRVRGMDPARLMGLVAEVSGGEWERTEGGLRLTIDGGRWGRLRREETRARAAWIAHTLDDPAAQRPDSRRGEDAASAFAAAKAVGAAALAELGPGERVVWSTLPSRLQRGLPDGFFRTVRDAEARRRVANEQAAEKLDRPEIAKGPRPAATALVIARREPSTDRLWVTLATYDATGDEAMMATQALDPPLPPASEALARRLPSAAKPFPAAVQDWGHRWLWSPALRERGLHPEREEPLALGIGPAVEAVADIAGLDLVACLPDAAYEPALDEIGRGLSSAWAMTFGRLGLRSRIDEGALVLSPSSPWTTLAVRADRRRLRDRIAEAEVEGDLNYRYGRPTELEAAHLAGLSPGAFANALMGSGAAWTFAAQWDALSDAQREKALNGGLSEVDAPGTDLRLLSLAFVEEAGGAAGRLDDETTALYADPRPAVLSARLVPHAGGVYQAADGSLPRATWTLDALGALLANTDPAWPQNRPGTRFWPADWTAVQMRLEIGGRQIYTVDFDRTARERSTGYLAPDYFPALRELLRPKG